MIKHPPTPQQLTLQLDELPELILQPYQDMIFEPTPALSLDSPPELKLEPVVELKLQPVPELILANTSLLKLSPAKLTLELDSSQVLMIHIGKRKVQRQEDQQ